MYVCGSVGLFKKCYELIGRFTGLNYGLQTNKLKQHQCNKATKVHQSLGTDSFWATSRTKNELCNHKITSTATEQGSKEG